MEVGGCGRDLTVFSASDDTKKKMYSSILVVGGGLMFHKAQEFLQHRLLNKMPPSFRRIIENVEVITRPKVSRLWCKLGCLQMKPALIICSCRVWIDKILRGMGLGPGVSERLGQMEKLQQVTEEMKGALEQGDRIWVFSLLRSPEVAGQTSAFVKGQWGLMLSATTTPRLPLFHIKHLLLVPGPSDLEGSFRLELS